MNTQRPEENALAGPQMTPLAELGGKRPMPGQQQEAMELDLVEIAFMLLDQLHFIVFFFLLGALVCNAYAYFFIPPTYQSTASLYMVSASAGTMVNLSDLNLGSSLTSDYQELILSYPVLDLVSEKMNLGIGTGAMRSMISINNPSGTRILRLTATAGSPELARDVANTLAEVAIEYLPETMGTVAPNIAQRARLNTGKAGPDINRYTMLGGVLGAGACCGWFVLLYMLNDTIRSSEDMEKYFGAAPLASIPYAEELNSGAQERKHRRKKRGSR